MFTKCSTHVRYKHGEARVRRVGCNEWWKVILGDRGGRGWWWWWKNSPGLFYLIKMTVGKKRRRNVAPPWLCAMIAVWFGRIKVPQLALIEFIIHLSWAPRGMVRDGKGVNELKLIGPLIHGPLLYCAWLSRLRGWAVWLVWVFCVQWLYGNCCVFC